MCTRYPNYRVNISGIGRAPEGEEAVGECSQMACFVRRDLLSDQLPNIETDEMEAEVSPFPVEKFEYKLLFKNDFPVDEDKRSVEEIILHDVEYFFARFTYKFDEDFYYSMERDRYEFPMQQIFECVFTAPDYDELKSIVATKYCVEENDIVVVPVPVEDSSSEFEEYENENECDNTNTGADGSTDEWWIVMSTRLKL